MLSTVRIAHLTWSENQVGVNVSKEEALNKGVLAQNYDYIVKVAGVLNDFYSTISSVEAKERFVKAFKENLVRFDQFVIFQSDCVKDGKIALFRSEEELRRIGAVMVT